MTNTFKSGDRVRYVGYCTPSLEGQVGTVEEQCSPSSVLVCWDSGDEQKSVLIENVELVQPDRPEPSFKPGDRVRYVGTFTQSLVGQEGIVESITSNRRGARVRWFHNGTTSLVFFAHLAVVSTPSAPPESTLTLAGTPDEMVETFFVLPREQQERLVRGWLTPVAA